MNFSPTNLKFNPNTKVLLFVLSWGLINLLQAGFTELIDDEAYYWMYSNYLDWGFFDHPPLTALLIKLGYFLIPNELGVRLCFVLMGAGTIYMIWTLLPKHNKHMNLIVLIIPAVLLMNVNVAGFVSTPDIPLVFLSVLFFILYKKYIEIDNWLVIVLLGILISIMLYTKYHVLLLLGFTILSNIKIIQRRSFWIIVGIALLLFIPHIVWQVKNDFPTLGYHLVGRNKFFELRQVPEYLLNQILVTGPFVGIILLLVSFRYRPTNLFERALKFNLIGFFGFFLIASLKGHVEPHWTSMAFPAMLILAIPEIAKKQTLGKWVRNLAYITLPIVIILRLFLVFNFLPFSDHVKRMLHDKDKFVSQIEEFAGDRPVVFTNSYQKASLYNFYSEGLATSRNTLQYRKNQYDIWNFEEIFQGKEVVYFPWGFKNADSLNTIFDTIPVKILNPYWSFTRIKIRTSAKEFRVKPGAIFHVKCNIENYFDSSAQFQKSGSNRTRIYYTYSGKGIKPLNYIEVINSPLLEPLKPRSSIEVDLEILAPIQEGSYKMILSIGSKQLYPALNGERLSVIVAR